MNYLVKVAIFGILLLIYKLLYGEVTDRNILYTAFIVLLLGQMQLEDLIKRRK